MSQRELLGPSTHTTFTPEAIESPGPPLSDYQSSPTAPELELTSQPSLSAYSDLTATSDTGAGHPGLCSDFLSALQRLVLGLPPDKSQRCERCLARFKQGSAHAKECGGLLEYSEEDHCVLYVCGEGHSWPADLRKVRKDRWCAACNKQQRCAKKAKLQEEAVNQSEVLQMTQERLFREAAERLA